MGDLGKEWFDREVGVVSKPFEAWWVVYYGPPDSCADHAEDQMEHWKRKAFTWSGWKACAEEVQAFVAALEEGGRKPERLRAEEGWTEAPEEGVRGMGTQVRLTVKMAEEMHIEHIRRYLPIMEDAVPHYRGDDLPAAMKVLEVMRRRVREDDVPRLREAQPGDIIPLTLDALVANGLPGVPGFDLVAVRKTVFEAKDGTAAMTQAYWTRSPQEHVQNIVRAAKAMEGGARDGDPHRVVVVLYVYDPEEPRQVVTGLPGDHVRFQVDYCLRVEHPRAKEVTR